MTIVEDNNHLFRPCFKSILESLQCKGLGEKSMKNCETVYSFWEQGELQASRLYISALRLFIKLVIYYSNELHGVIFDIEPSFHSWDMPRLV